MNFIIEKTEPYNESFIYNIEEKFKIKIPKTLKKYYLKYGDSEIRNCKIKINNLTVGVAEIVSLDKNDPNSFYQVINDGRLDGWIPDYFYPFAHNSGGDYYFWDSRNEHIYLIFNDNIENPVEICKSMKDFFKLMEKSK